MSAHFGIDVCDSAGMSAGWRFISLGIHDSEGIIVGEGALWLVFLMVSVLVVVPGWRI